VSFVIFPQSPFWSTVTSFVPFRDEASNRQQRTTSEKARAVRDLNDDEIDADVVGDLWQGLATLEQLSDNTSGPTGPRAPSQNGWEGAEAQHLKSGRALGVPT
jgi:hypothetical protein